MIIQHTQNLINQTSYHFKSSLCHGAFLAPCSKRLQPFNTGPYPASYIVCVLGCHRLCLIMCYTRLQHYNPLLLCVILRIQASCVRPDPRHSYPGPKSPSRSPPDLPETPLLIMQQELKANILLLARGPLGFEGTPNISVSRETALEQFAQSSPHILPETSSEQGR